MKKPWYIWFSVIAFMFLYFISAIQIILKKKIFFFGLDFVENLLY